jgi:PAS domain S-box-containing protein
VDDITERKQAAEQLAQSDAYWPASQGLDHVGCWAWNVASGDFYWSQETFRIFGFDPVQTPASMTETFLSRIHPEDRARIEEGIKFASRETSDHATDYRIVLPDGSIRFIHDVVYPVTNEAGEVVARYGLVIDVTGRKEAGEKLQHSFGQMRALAARLQSVREEERSRVAREIHDELGQAMTAIKMDLASVTLELPPERKQAFMRIERCLKLVDETIQVVRRIATELRPGILDDLGLGAAVEWAAEEFHSRTGIKCRVRLPEADIALDSERATALFRILQETMTNVARHANATEVEVTLAETNGSLSMRIHDNGRGISDDDLAESRSLGILGMRERALLLGGRLTINGSPAKGTTVKVRVPAMRLDSGADV